MRKISSLLMLLCVFAVAAWAQTVAPVQVTDLTTLDGSEELTIATKKRGGWAVNADKTKFASTNDCGMGTTMNAAYDQQIFSFETVEGKLYLYSVYAKMYVKNDRSLVATTDEASPLAYVAKDNGTFFFKFDDDKNINIGGSNQMIVDDWGTHDDGNIMTIMDVTELRETYPVVTFKYSFVFNSKEIATQEYLLFAGYDSYPNYQLSALPYGIGAPTKPEGVVPSDGIVEGVVTETITLIEEKPLPFETADAADAITKWYYMRMHTNQPGFVGEIADDNTINVANGKTAAKDDENIENFKWGFVGDVFTGITVVNKGTGKQLTSTGSGNVTLTESGTPFFVANTSETTENAKYGFCLRKQDSNQYVNANYSASKLSHWRSTDAGSTFFLTEVDMTEEVVVAESGYATFYLNTPVSIPEDVEAYIVTGVEGTAATLSEITGVLPANTGIIVKATADKTYEFVASAEAVATTTGNLLRGSTSQTYVTPTATTGKVVTCYALSQPEGKEVGLYKVTLNKNANGEEGTVAFQNNAKKAYLWYEIEAPAEEPAAAPFFRFDFGTETAIESIQGAESANTVVYDLAGRRVQGAQKGLYIVNGKKVIK